MRDNLLVMVMLACALVAGCADDDDDAAPDAGGDGGSGDADADTDADSDTYSGWDTDTPVTMEDLCDKLVNVCDIMMTYADCVDHWIDEEWGTPCADLDAYLGCLSPCMPLPCGGELSTCEYDCYSEFCD